MRRRGPVQSNDHWWIRESRSGECGSSWATLHFVKRALVLNDDPRDRRIDLRYNLIRNGVGRLSEVLGRDFLLTLAPKNGHEISGFHFGRFGSEVHAQIIHRDTPRNWIRLSLV